MKISIKIIFLFFYLAILIIILNFIPTYKYPLPARLISFTSRTLIILLLTVWLAGLFIKKTALVKNNSKKLWKIWKNFIFILVVLISTQVILYFSFPLSYGTKPPLPSINQKPALIPATEVKVSDDRCTFNIEDYAGPLKVVRFNDEDILTNAKYEYQIPGYLGNRLIINYINNKSRAISLISDNLYLLDFNSCLAQPIPPNFTYNVIHFQLGLRSISSDEKYILYEIFKGFDAPPFPGTENDYSQVDAAKNGLWLYNLESEKLFQIRFLPVNSETDDLQMSWQENMLVLKGINCPLSGCQYNLENY